MPTAKPLIVSYSGDDYSQGDLAAPPVPWWSITKTCLAACALVLVARGRLSLDERLPDRAYTLRQLLQHTSGLGSYTARPEYHAAIDRKDTPWTDSEVLARVRLDPFLFEPGQDWSYSNTGYFLIRGLIEQTTDAEIDTVLKTLVLSPLGIQHTRMARQPADLDACAWGNVQDYHPGWVFHGLLIGPPAEAAIFMHGLLTSEFLPVYLRTAMRECRMLDTSLKDRPWHMTGYGLGLMINSVAPLGTCLGHTGQGSSVAAVYHFPDLNPPRTVGSFAPSHDQAFVERAVLDAAARQLCLGASAKTSGTAEVQG